MARSSTAKPKSSSPRPTYTPEAQENRMISYALDLAEKQLREGTASPSLVVEMVKRGSTKARLEKEILEEQKKLIQAKTESLESAKKSEELYAEAIKAMQLYSGHGGRTEPEEDYN